MKIDETKETLRGTRRNKYGVKRNIRKNNFSRFLLSDGCKATFDITNMFSHKFIYLLYVFNFVVLLYNLFLFHHE